MLKRVLYGIGIESELAELIGKHTHIIRMAMANRNYGMTAIQVGVNLAVPVP
jgi:hypothetical protein